MPLVSVVIAGYNRSNFIAETLHSVLDQTVQDLEVIVVDDGSTDDTGSVVAQFADRVRYVYQDNAERGAARNHGLRLAKGRFVSFLDSDDLWRPNKLEEELKRFHEVPGVGLVYSDADLIDEIGCIIGRMSRVHCEGDVLPRIALRNFIPFGAHLVERKHFIAAGGFSEDRNLSGSEDWEVWVRLAARVRFAHARNTGLLYRQHGGATVADPTHMERSMSRAIDIIFGNPDLSPRIGGLKSQADAQAHRVLASYFYTAGRFSGGVRHILAAVRGYPGIVFDPDFLSVLARVLAGRQMMGHLRRLKQSMLDGKKHRSREGA